MAPPPAGLHLRLDCPDVVSAVRLVRTVTGVRMSNNRALYASIDGGRVLLLAAVLLAFPLVPHGAQGRGDVRDETYRTAAVDPDGRLVITATDGRTTVVPKSPGQRSWGTPRLSDDRRAVGVQELHP